MIYGPYEGSLYIYGGLSGRHTLKGSTIYSNHSENIYINLTSNIEKDGGKEMEIYGQDVENMLHITCAGDCTDSKIYCPGDGDTEARFAGNCVIDCSKSKDDEDDWCQDMEIYAYYGIPKSVKFSPTCIFFHIYLQLILSMINNKKYVQ